MEAIQLLAKELQDGIEKRDKCTSEMEQQIEDCQTYLREEL